MVFYGSSNVFFFLMAVLRSFVKGLTVLSGMANP